MKKIFIDGSAGTTGLRIYERIGGRTDIELIMLPEEERKDPAYRRAALNTADIVFLCLPDDAAIEAVGMIEDPDTVVIDTSTAHRTAPGWVYGFPELSENIRAHIAESRRIAVPGCHASGFIALVAPLVEAGILSPGAMLCCHSLTGYSGGGKKMIAQYEDAERCALLGAPRQYGLAQKHKHLREMKAITGLEHEPVFCPIVADFYSGMEVTVPLFVRQVNGTADDIRDVYRTYYTDGLVRFTETPDSDGLLSAAALAGRDDMEISVFGNDTRILLTARFDNLGKGASGAAIQNLNILLGIDQAMGLNV